MYICFENYPKQSQIQSCFGVIFLGIPEDLDRKTSESSTLPFGESEHQHKKESQPLQADSKLLENAKTPKSPKTKRERSRSRRGRRHGDVRSPRRSHRHRSHQIKKSSEVRGRSRSRRHGQEKKHPKDKRSFAPAQESKRKDKDFQRHGRERSHGPPTLRRLGRFHLKSCSPPRGHQEGYKDVALTCPICFKPMRTENEFSLTQHIWSCHPESDEAKKRSKEFKNASKLQKEAIKRSSSVHSRGSVQSCPADMRRPPSVSMSRKSQRAESWHAGQDADHSYDTRPPLRRRHPVVSERRACRDDDTTEPDEIQPECPAPQSVPAFQPQPAPSHSTALEQGGPPDAAMMSQFFKTTQLFFTHRPAQ